MEHMFEKSDTNSSNISPEGVNNLQNFITDTNEPEFAWDNTVEPNIEQDDSLQSQRNSTFYTLPVIETITTSSNIFFKPSSVNIINNTEINERKIKIPHLSENHKFSYEIGRRKNTAASFEIKFSRDELNKFVGGLEYKSTAIRTRLKALTDLLQGSAILLFTLRSHPRLVISPGKDRTLNDLDHNTIQELFNIVGKTDNKLITEDNYNIKFLKDLISHHSLKPTSPKK